MRQTSGVREATRVQDGSPGCDPCSTEAMCHHQLFPPAKPHASRLLKVLMPRAAFARSSARTFGEGGLVTPQAPANRSRSSRPCRYQVTKHVCQVEGDSFSQTTQTVSCCELFLQPADMSVAAAAACACTHQGTTCQQAHTQTHTHLWLAVCGLCEVPLKLFDVACNTHANLTAHAACSSTGLHCLEGQTGHCLHGVLC